MANATSCNRISSAWIFGVIFARLAVNIWNRFCMDSMDYLQKSCFYFIFHTLYRAQLHLLGISVIIFKILASNFCNFRFKYTHVCENCNTMKE